jgi:predicted ATPase/class 3 adenylate cyclase
MPRCEVIDGQVLCVLAKIEYIIKSSMNTGTREDKQATLRSIGAYVPGFLVRRVMADPHASLAGQEERMSAALLFADVSGFTAMSESLAQLGKEGAEELTRVLNDYFTTMIDLVRGYGGQIIKFGGDAITCAFASEPAPTPSHEPSTSLQTDIIHACACALAMQQEMGKFQAVETRGGVFDLRMKIGISAGSVLSLTVGDPQEGLEYVLAGHPLDRMAEAEHHAAAGEVVVDGECIAGLETSWDELGVVVGEEREGFLLIEEMAQAVKRAEEEEMDWGIPREATTEQAIAQLALFLPQTVYEQIIEGQRLFLGEHRRVVSLLVNFFGLDYDNDPVAGQKLQQYFTAMQGIIHRYGGRLNRVITGDKGSLLHLLFGAPVAYENNEERAVGCALEMQQIVLASDELPFITDQQIGISSGYVFAGNVGAERRREYTVMGDVVNLSARLMQAAGSGEILMDRGIARRVEQDFVCEELPPIRVKGKQEPIPVCRPMGLQEETKIWTDGEARARRRESPFVGREQELARMEEILDQAMAERGQLLVIAGEAGVGKSRLLEELIELGRKKGKGMYGLRGDCLSYGSQSPYLPWIDLFASFFGLGSGEEEETESRVHRVEQRMVEADPGLRDWVPLIGQLLGLPTPDNELTASLDAELRKQRTFDIVLTLLRDQAKRVPFFLVVFEDAHWIDAISLELLNYVARNIGDHRILLVALHRPTVDLAEWKQYDYYSRIELTDLPADDALNLVKLRLSMADVPSPLQERVLRGEERVNPFWVEELINSLVDREYLVPDNGEGYRLVGDLSRAEIPDSVQALVMSRIDRLDESSKLSAKVASVIGRTFRYQPLYGIYPVAITQDKLHENLDKLSRLDLTPLDRPAPDWEYIFKNIITQEVAYESLLYRHRRELHHRMGEYLEETYPDSLEEYYELLADHYVRSGDRDKSWDYLVRAGDKAKELYANDAAIARYSLALSMETDREDVYRVHESLGDVYRLIGQYDNALQSYQEALEDAPPIAVQIADINLKIARVWGEQGRYDEAMHYLDLARTAHGEEQETSELARVYESMGWIRMRQGNYEEALRLCEKGLDLAAPLSRDERGYRVKARLQHTLGTIYWRMGNYPQATTHFETCIETWESTGDLYEMGRAYNNLANVYGHQGNLTLAAEYFQNSSKIFERIGFTRGTASSYNNLGIISSWLGDFARAIEYYERSLGLMSEIGEPLGIADVHNNLGEVYLSLGDYEQALHYLQQAVVLYQEIGDKTALIEPYKFLAGVELELNNLAEAREYCQLLLEIAQEIGNQEYEGVAYRVLGQICRAEGRPEEARQHLQDSVETLASVGARLELGKSHYELGITLSEMGLVEGQEELHQAVLIFEELGVEGELEKTRAALADR